MATVCAPSLARKPRRPSAQPPRIVTVYFCSDCEADEAVPHSVYDSRQLAKVEGRAEGAKSSKSVRTLKVTFPGNRFTVVDVGPYDNTWVPKHCFDYPKPSRLDRYTAAWEDYGEPQIFASRELALAEVAKRNRVEDYDPKCGGEDWAVALELGETGQPAGVFGSYIQGEIGVIHQSLSLIYRLVRPTTSERRRFAKAEMV